MGENAVMSIVRFATFLCPFNVPSTFGCGSHVEELLNLDPATRVLHFPSSGSSAQIWEELEKRKREFEAEET